MGIFSLFGKKDSQATRSADKGTARARRVPDSSRAGESRGVRAPVTRRDAQAALATALKIDEIESEMSSEFVVTTTIPSGNTLPGNPATLPPKLPYPSAATQKARGRELPPLEFPAGDGASMGTTTGFLLEGQTTINEVALPSTEATAVIEEAAILYANNQIDMVEQMLQAAVAEDIPGDATLGAWWMLFDLYQIIGKQQEFENLSIAYAGRFETSPPAWNPPVQGELAQAQPAQPSSATPMVPFSGKLDSGCVKQLMRVQKLAESHRALRLEFNRVTQVDPVGCGLLLNVLTRLQKSGHELILVGAPELAEKIRGILQVGRRDETEEPWMLLMEILRLLNRESEFEEVSIDYCITFEVSPPAFVAPENKVTTEAPGQADDADAAEVFRMPPVIEGKIDQLILAIANYSDEHDPACIDCAQLTRVDFNAAGRLMTGLTPFCGNGKVIEFQRVNHLVAALFNMIGLKDIVRIQPNKY